MRLTKLIVLCVVVLGLFATLYYGLNNNNVEQNTSMMNEPVPSFQLQSLDETQVLTEGLFISNEFKLLNIWASWCAACKTEHPFLLELANSGVKIIGLNYRDNRPDALKVIASDGNPYTQIIYDPNGQLALDLGVLGAPETFVIDSNGKIAARVSGVINPEIWQDKFGHLFNKHNNTN